MAQGLASSQLPKEYQGITVWGYVTDNPSIVATEGTQGQFVVFLPSGALYQKADNGKTTNWVLKSFQPSSSSEGIYPVYPGGPFSSIQAAVNQAVTDGHDGSNPAFIIVSAKSGGWNEVVQLPSGIVVSTPYNDPRVVRVVGGFKYVSGSGSFENEYSSVSGFTIIDNSSDISLEYAGTTGSTFIVTNCLFEKNNNDSDCIKVSNPHGNFIIENFTINSTRNNININILDGEATLAGSAGASSVNGGKKGLSTTSSQNVNILGTTFNGNSSVSTNQSTIDVLAGLVIFSLGGLGSGNVDPNPCGFYVASGATLVLFNCSNLVVDNGTNRCVEGVAGGTVLYGLIYDFPGSTNKVNPALTLAPVNTGLISA